MESSVSQSLNRLLVRARQGSRSALNRLMASHRWWLRGRVTKRLPRDIARKVDASDLVQEVQYQAAAGFSKFEGRSVGEFRAWLMGILKRRIFREFRFWGQERRNPMREEPLSPAGSECGEPAESATSILEKLAHEEECDRLMLAAGWCREEDVAVILKHLWDGRSHEEIAVELEIAPATVRQRYRRAVRSIRKASDLQELMTRHGLGTLQQDVIGLHRFQGVDSQQIALRLQVPEPIVARWIAEAQPLVRAIAKDGP
jgi:RNA polymerase sigma-70 factor, ECF subfamily